jgi:hypothetical protein
MSQCSAINKTTGTRCKSRAANPCGTCKRHPPQPPSEEELAAAAAALKTQLLLTPLHPVPPEESLTDPALTVEQLEDLRLASGELWFKHPDYGAHLALSLRCKFLGLQNEFYQLWGQIRTNEFDRLYYEMACSDRQRERR